MLGAHFSTHDVDALRELLPDSAIDRDGTIDYREVQWLLQNHAPRREAGAPVYAPDSRGLGLGDWTPSHLSRTTGSIPALGHSPFLPPGHRRVEHSTYEPVRPQSLYQDVARSIPTPSGLQLASPMYDPRDQTLPAFNHGAAAGAYEKMLAGIADRVSLAIEEKSRSWGGHFSLLRQFEVTERSL